MGLPSQEFPQIRYSPGRQILFLQDRHIALIGQEKQIIRTAPLSRLKIPKRFRRRMTTPIPKQAAPANRGISSSCGSINPGIRRNTLNSQSKSPRKLRRFRRFLRTAWGAFSASLCLSVSSHSLGFFWLFQGPTYLRRQQRGGIQGRNLKGKSVFQTMPSSRKISP